MFIKPPLQQIINEPNIFLRLISQIKQLIMTRVAISIPSDDFVVQACSKLHLNHSHVTPSCNFTAYGGSSPRLKLVYSCSHRVTIIITTQKNIVSTILLFIYNTKASSFSVVTLRSAWDLFSSRGILRSSL